MVMGNALWQLIKESDTVSQLVLLLLLGMSITCWTIFLYKILVLRAKKKNLEAAIAHLRQISNLEQLLEAVPLFSGTYAGYFLSRNLTSLKSFLEARPEGEIAGLTKDHWEMMEQHINQTVDDMLYQEESYLSVISTSAATATLLGLFGTVWGLIHSFVRISQQQSADIAVVAPGIAEALITTLAGLMIAIPALAMFSFINAEIRTVEQRLVTLADRFSFIVQRQLVFKMPELKVAQKHYSGGSHATL